jgi:hypothetical protein
VGFKVKSPFGRALAAASPPAEAEALPKGNLQNGFGLEALKYTVTRVNGESGSQKY